MFLDYVIKIIVFHSTEAGCEKHLNNKMPSAAAASYSLNNLCTLQRNCTY